MLGRAANLPPSPPRSPRYDRLYERGVNGSPTAAAGGGRGGGEATPDSGRLPSLSLGPSERDEREAIAIAQTEKLVKGRTETPGRDEGTASDSTWLLFSAVAVSAAAAYAFVRLRQGKALV